MRQVIGNFLNYLTVEKGFPPNTIAAYRNDLNQLAGFIEEEAAKRGSIPPWASFDRQSMLSYLLDLPTGAAIVCVFGILLIVQVILETFLSGQG